MTKKTILDCNDTEAKEFFMQDSQYCNFDLPPYFSFELLLAKIADNLPEDLLRKYPSKKYELANYTLLSNKNGRYNWRPLELIHPALYVELVNVISDSQNWAYIKKRTQELGKDAPNIICASWPAISSKKSEKQRAAQISEWWVEMEQQSIKLGLEFNHLFKADISNCYGSLYTHSIAWALHTKPKSKKNHEDTLVGNRIDQCIQAMRNGETNGIPQGSVLMDLVAEIVLKYIDSELAKRLKKSVGSYKIIRYRDDYNIFVNNPNDGRQILKALSEALAEVKMQLNDEKIHEAEDLITAIIKPDKLELFNLPIFAVKMVNQGENSNFNNINNFQQTILQIYSFSLQHPNSGSIPKVLAELRKRHEKMPINRDQRESSISILVNMIEKNPRYIPNILSLISSISSGFNKFDKKRIVNSVVSKLATIPNTGYLDIYLQRMSYGSFKKAYDEQLTKVVVNKNHQKKLWNSDWLKNLGAEGKELKKIVESESIINSAKLVELHGLRLCGKPKYTVLI